MSRIRTPKLSSLKFANWQSLFSLESYAIPRSIDAVILQFSDNIFYLGCNYLVFLLLILGIITCVSPALLKSVGMLAISYFILFSVTKGMELRMFNTPLSQNVKVIIFLVEAIFVFWLFDAFSLITHTVGCCTLAIGFHAFLFKTNFSVYHNARHMKHPILTKTQVISKRTLDNETEIDHATYDKEELLSWAQNRTRSYQGVKVENFSTSWWDGLALCALIDSYYPGRLDVNNLSPENKVENIALALRFFGSIGVTPLFNAEDCYDAPPEYFSLLAFLSSARYRLESRGMHS